MAAPTGVRAELHVVCDGQMGDKLMSALRRLSAACSTLLVASGLVLVPFLTGPAAAAELLQDGGFESATGNPALSPNWTEADSVRSSPLCNTTACTNVNGTSVPRSGNAWVRFGGSDQANHTASISQAVVIPAGTATLTYWYRNGEVSTPYTATLQVKVDGTTVKTHTETSPAQSTYTQQSVNLSTYANGASHTISFNYANNATGTNRMIVDDVSLTHTAPPVTTGTPTVTSTVPATQGATTTPLVKGTAETGSTVTLYSNNSCSSAALGSGPAATYAGAGITATVPANATTTIYAKATKSGQNASACSSTSASFTSDTTAPPLVTFASVTPTSPNPSTTPVLKGTAQAGSTVKIYATSGCTGTPVATGTAAELTSPGLTATVVVGTTTTFKATATDAVGNTSACSSSSLVYTSDLFDGGFEATVGSDSPSWVEADSLVGSPLCLKSTCDSGGGVTAPRTGNAWAWFGGVDGPVSAGQTASLAQTLTIPVGTLSLTYYYKNGSVTAPFDAQLLVQVDGTTVKTTFEAPVADEAYSLQYADLSAYANGASHTISFEYTNGAEGLNSMTVDDVHLSAVSATLTGTPTVTATVPVSPSTSTTPLVKGTAEAGSTVTLYSNSTCTSAALGAGPAAAFAGTGITATVPMNAITRIYARASKAAQRDSACSPTFATYTAAAPPDTQLTKKPKKKVLTLKRKARVTFKFTSPTVGAKFECSVDGAAYAACTSGQKFKLKLGKHTFLVRAVAAGMADATPEKFSFKIKRRH